MRLAARYHDFDEFADRTAAAAAAIADVLNSSSRSPALHEGGSSGAARIDQLIRSGARIDAALALIALELPQWQLRRIAYDGGEWHCALSRTRDLADWLDQSAEGRHADLALALLAAAMEAHQVAVSSHRSSARSIVPPAPNTGFTPLCCDNFS
jgi:hypothetical protein